MQTFLGVRHGFLPHERLLQPVATSVRLCFETTNQPSPIVSSLANGNFCKKRSCRPQGNFRETISVSIHASLKIHDIPCSHCKACVDETPKKIVGSKLICFLCGCTLNKQRVRIFGKSSVDIQGSKPPSMWT